MSRSLRIAMLAHSTNPRGGVVHAMQLSEAPAELGHEAVLHAPDSKGTGFSRAPKCESRAFAVAPAPADLLAMIEQRIADYAAHFSRSENRDFDLYHAQDGISGNALTTLKDQGMIGGFVSRRAPFAKRTAAWSSARSGATASARLSPSTRPFAAMGSTPIGTVRIRMEGSIIFAGAWEVGPEPVLLCVGGIEARKNSTRILAAFEQLLASRPDAELVIAGGASLLDHGQYQAEFEGRLASMSAAAAAVRRPSGPGRSASISGSRRRRGPAPPARSFSRPAYK